MFAILIFGMFVCHFPLRRHLELIMSSLCGSEETAPHLNLKEHAMFLSEVDETTSKVKYLQEDNEVTSYTQFQSEVNADAVITAQDGHTRY